MTLLPVTAAEMDARHRHRHGARGLHGLRGQGSGRLMWRCGANRGAAFRPPGAGGHGGRESVAPLPFRRGTGGHAAALCAALQPASAAVRFGQQDALAGDEGLAQNDAGAVQKTALSPSGMRHLRFAHALRPTPWCHPGHSSRFVQKSPARSENSVPPLNANARPQQPRSTNCEVP